jgi:hypothetical protein
MLTLPRYGESRKSFMDRAEVSYAELRKEEILWETYGLTKGHTPKAGYALTMKGFLVREFLELPFEPTMSHAIVFVNRWLSYMEVCGEPLSDEALRVRILTVHKGAMKDYPGKVSRINPGRLRQIVMLIKHFPQFTWSVS